MSVVIAVNSPNGEAWMGADRRYTWDDSSFITIGSSKIIRRNGFLVGGVGSYRAFQIIRAHNIFPGHLPGEPIMPYLVSTIVPRIREAFRGEGLSAETTCTLLFASDAVLAIINSDFTVLEPLCRYAAIGAGEAYALGALYALTSMTSRLSAKKEIEIALDAAAKFSSSVGDELVDVEKVLRGEAKNDL